MQNTDDSWNYHIPDMQACWSHDWLQQAQIINDTIQVVKTNSTPENYTVTVKPVYSQKAKKIGIQDKLSLNAGQKYCRMLQGEHFAILWTFIKLPFVIKIFALSIFEWSVA